LATRGGVVLIDIQEPPEGWARLRRLDKRATARLTLSRWPSSPQSWVLEQAGTPVGMIKRAAASTRLRTASEEWRVGARRRPSRLGWYLEFTRVGGEPALSYHPHTLLGGGSLALVDGRRDKLRSPLLRSDWRVTALWGGEIGRIAFRGGTSAEGSRTQVAFREQAEDEPLLLVVLLAASTAILLHAEQPRIVAYHG
jgi:hypothetical protein